ncbi:MAG: phage terminase large subunit [Nitrososphaerales archaeon]
MEQALKKLKDDPVLFAKHILNFQPFDYQEKILRDDSDRLAAICGRQIGKSTCSAIKLIHFAVSNPKTTSIIVSATLRQSLETFDKVRSFVENSVLRKSVKRATRTQIWFKNGSRIICLPSGRYGSTLRGLTVHFAVVDEAAFIYEEVITQVIFPMLMTTKGKIWMLTTPCDKDHITYKVFNSKDWSVYHLPSSVSPLVTKEFLEEQRELIGEERFKQEYEGQFIDDSNAYFPMTLIRSILEDYQPQPQPNGYGGYDPGGKESYAAFVVVVKETKKEEKEHDVLKLIYSYQVRGLSYTEFNLKIQDFHKQYPLSKLCYDATGLGASIGEHLNELNIKNEGIKLTQPKTEELFSNLKLLMERKEIILPHNLDLINSLNCIEYERTRTGGYKFSHRTGTYSDLAYALALACYAVKSEPKTIMIRL